MRWGSPGNSPLLLYLIDSQLHIYSLFNLPEIRFILQCNAPCNHCQPGSSDASVMLKTSDKIKKMSPSVYSSFNKVMVFP